MVTVILAVARRFHVWIPEDVKENEARYENKEVGRLVNRT